MKGDRQIDRQTEKGRKREKKGREGAIFRFRKEEKDLAGFLGLLLRRFCGQAVIQH